MKNLDLAKQIEELSSKIKSTEDVLVKKQFEFDQQMEPLNKALEEYNTKIEELQDQLIEGMEKESVGSLKTDNHSFVLTRRVDIKLADEKALSEYVIRNAHKLKGYLELKTKDEVIEVIMPRKVSVTNAKTLAKRARDIDEFILPGMEETITKYITTKQL